MNLTQRENKAMSSIEQALVQREKRLVSKHYSKEEIAKITPTGWHILIEVDAAEKISEGGIVIAKTDNQFRREQAGRTTGIVLAVGPEAWSRSPAPWAKVGDTVFFKRYSGPELKLNGHDKLYFSVTDEDIFLVMPRELAEEVE